MATKPTATSNKISALTANIDGNPTPLPIKIPSGVTLPTTSGDAAATTMNTIEKVPREPVSVPRSSRPASSSTSELFNATPLLQCAAIRLAM
jgi:hypothetical protein